MAIKKPHNDLSRLFKRLRVELPGLVLEPSCLRAPIETRDAPLEVRLDYEPEARALRIYVALPTPVGAETSRASRSRTACATASTISF